MPYGRTLASTSIGYPTRVSAEGAPRYKQGGITLDLTTITAASGSDITLPDGSLIKANNQFLRYGQILCKITTPPVQTLTGTATGGTFTITLVRPDTQQAVTTAAIAFGASAATVLAAIQAVMGANQAVSATGGILGSAPVVVTFGNALPLATLNTSLLTGGTVTIANTTPALSNGKYGQYDSSASDGRQNLNRGECYIIDETFLVTPAGSQLPAANDIIGGVFDGGPVYIDRVLQSGVASHSLAAGPTKAEFLAAFGVSIVEN